MKLNKSNNRAKNEIAHCQQCAMRNIALFSDLQCNDFELLHQPITIIELQGGDILYEEKQAARYVYTIRSGLLKQVKYLADGSYRIVRLLRQGDLAGIESLNNTFYMHHTIALEKATFCKIPIENIEILNQKSPNIRKPLTARWHKIQQDADIWLTELTVGHSKQRVAKLLVYLADENYSESFFLPSREDIGALLSITTETASRVIAEFKRQGCLQTERHYAKINLLKLKQLY